MYLPRMSIPRAAVLVSALVLLISGGLISCGSDSGGGGKGGTGGAGGSTGGAGAGGGGNGGPGTAGATGSAGNGGGSCQSCVSCVTSKCSSQVTSCMANSGCNMIYTCAHNCATSIQTCIQNNVAVAQMFVSSVYPCISSNCMTECTY
jgi:hypothetical protein